jgi:thiol-disulfide isomerase/thioredoxin
MSQQMNSTGGRLAFLHGFPGILRSSPSELASLEQANGWLNSQPLTAEALRGKVVLVNVWTYTCINWLRQLPYVRAWAEKYQDQGLVVIGVHSPEFAFEKNLDNVRQAVKCWRIGYPVAIDNDFGIWRGFDNHYWPALYFIDGQGRVRHSQFGEGQYEQSEMVIQRLLAEAGSPSVGDELVSVDATGAEAAADWGSLKSPENYLGTGRTENFASPGGGYFDKQHAFEIPAKLRLNHWALSGDWTLTKDAVALNKAGGRIAYRFHARDLHLVMGPTSPGTSVRFRVTIDGQPPSAAHGVDVDEQGNGILTDQRMYQLIRQQSPSPTGTSRSSFSIPARRLLRSHSAEPRRAPCQSAPNFGSDAISMISAIMLRR